MMPIWKISPKIREYFEKPLDNLLNDVKNEDKNKGK